MDAGPYRLGELLAMRLAAEQSLRRQALATAVALVQPEALR
jgi:hypothetical protein